ncbi:LTA synthase family protein [Bacillus sp. JJ1764]|uniref:LTA synthase family protein n=1 Tax=Bacillus sp. JJ1764 TaxID=3122964 RepID=UPI003000F809
MNKRRFLSNSLTFLLLILSTIIFSASLYISIKFADQSVEEMIFYLVGGMKGASSDVFISGIKSSLIPFLLIFSLLALPLMNTKRRRQILEVAVKGKKINLQVFPNKFIRKYKVIYASIIFLFSLASCYLLLGIDEYVKGIKDSSYFIGNHYVSGTNVSITFPEKKRNLIILYMESMESSLIDKVNGGGWEYNVIPELENIAKQNVNFSNTSKIGGALPIYGTTWTVGGLVSTTSGLPLKIPVNGNEYTSSKNFLAGAYTLGDVLKKEGYNLEFMAGSDAEFGGRKNYYLKHGNYDIFDLNAAIKKGKMTESERVAWGFDDTHLFEYAKDEITSLANSDKPFSFSFLTVNTHFPDGYLESGAEKKFDTQYENVYAFSSKQVDEFVRWLQQQDFYQNTTLVLMGDHLSMQPGDYFKTHTYEGYQRTIYNAFVNPANRPVNEKNRIFSSLDMYPTILGSIGVTIDGERLGLGTNLFSNRKTLEEEYGFEHVNEEVAKNSDFYNRQILQGDYLELLDKAKKEKAESNQ